MWYCKPGNIFFHSSVVFLVWGYVSCRQILANTHPYNTHGECVCVCVLSLGLWDIWGRLQPRLIHCFCLVLIRSGSLLNRTDDASASHWYVCFDGPNVLNGQIYFRGVTISLADRIETEFCAAEHAVWRSQLFIHIIYRLWVQLRPHNIHTQGVRLEPWQRLMLHILNHSISATRWLEDYRRCLAEEGFLTSFFHVLQ